jgi:hypothetical protein
MITLLKDQAYQIQKLLNQLRDVLLFLYLNVLKVLLAAHQPSEFLSNIHQ